MLELRKRQSCLSTANLAKADAQYFAAFKCFSILFVSGRQRETVEIHRLLRSYIQAFAFKKTPREIMLL